MSALVMLLVLLFKFTLKMHGGNFGITLYIIYDIKRCTKTSKYDINIMFCSMVLIHKSNNSIPWQPLTVRDNVTEVFHVHGIYRQPDICTKGNFV